MRFKDRKPMAIVPCCVAVALVWSLCLAPTAAFCEESAPIVEDTRAALEKWVETQRVISKEKKDLALAKEMLNERIELVKREIDSLHGKISEAEESIAEADKKRAELIEENEKLKGAAFRASYLNHALWDGRRSEESLGRLFLLWINAKRKSRHYR